MAVANVMSARYPQTRYWECVDVAVEDPKAWRIAQVLLLFGFLGVQREASAQMPIKFTPKNIEVLINLAAGRCCKRLLGKACADDGILFGAFISR